MRLNVFEMCRSYVSLLCFSHSVKVAFVINKSIFVYPILILLKFIRYFVASTLNRNIVKTFLKSSNWNRIKKEYEARKYIEFNIK